MVIDINSKTAADFSRNFNARVTFVESFYGRERIKQRGKYVGYIDGDRFWLAKTKATFSLTSCRRFCGRIIEDNGEAFVQGDFKQDRVFLLILILFVFGFHLFCLIRDQVFLNMFKGDIISIAFCIFLFALGALYTAILLGVDKYYNRKHRKELVEFIAEL